MLEDISQAPKDVGISTNAEISAAKIETATGVIRVVVPALPIRKLLRDRLSFRLQLSDEVASNVGAGIVVVISVASDRIDSRLGRCSSPTMRRQDSLQFVDTAEQPLRAAQTIGIIEGQKASG